MHEKLAAKIFDLVFDSRDSEKTPKLSWETQGNLLTISLVSDYRKGIEKFFHDMITKWLIPGQYLEPAFYFFTKYKNLTIAQIVLELESTENLMRAKQNIPFLEREIVSGTQCFYQAKKILELKGLTLDEKTSFVQEKITQLLNRFPGYVDYDIFDEMQQLLIHTKDEFKAVRQPAEMSRIVFVLYQFRKSLEKKILKNPARRHFCLKLKKTLLHTPFGLKEVLAIFIGFNFLKEHEVFEERHFLSALRRFIPNASSIPGSHFAFDEDQFHRFYLEIEKEDQTSISSAEIKELEKGLPSEIRSRVEQLVPPIFMPRNEEEVMRNILILSKQLKFIRDIPQMIISFNEQDVEEISFNIVLVRIIHSNTIPIKELFCKSPLAKNLSIDRVKIVGMLRRKYPKEAVVMRVRLSTKLFLREDFSVDLFRARLHLACEVQNILGEVRDYNGGMIAKQSENFDALVKETGLLAEKYPLLLQNFFHSIFPVQLSTTCDPVLLKILFEMLIELTEASKETFILKSKNASDSLFVFIKCQSIDLKQKILHQIEPLGCSSTDLLTVQMQIFDSFYLGFILLNPKEEFRKKFFKIFTEFKLSHV